MMRGHIGAEGSTAGTCPACQSRQPARCGRSQYLCCRCALRREAARAAGARGHRRQWRSPSSCRGKRSPRGPGVGTRCSVFHVIFVLCSVTREAVLRYVPILFGCLFMVRPAKGDSRSASFFLLCASCYAGSFASRSVLLFMFSFCFTFRAYRGCE